MDRPREEYERLRDYFLRGGSMQENPVWTQFVLVGFFSLLTSINTGAYVVEVYEAPTPRWCGKRNPGQEALEQAYCMLV